MSKPWKDLIRCKDLTSIRFESIPSWEPKSYWNFVLSNTRGLRIMCEVSHAQMLSINSIWPFCSIRSYSTTVRSLVTSYSKLTYPTREVSKQDREFKDLARASSCLTTITSSQFRIVNTVSDSFRFKERSKVSARIMWNKSKRKLHTRLKSLWAMILISTMAWFR